MFKGNTPTTSFHFNQCKHPKMRRSPSKPAALSLSLVWFLWLTEMNMMMMMAQSQNTTISVNVGVVLDLENPEANKWLSCINMALSDFYAANSNYQTRLVLHTRDSMRDVVGAAAAGAFSSLSTLYLSRN